jgi:hypothetical protein
MFANRATHWRTLKSKAQVASWLAMFGRAAQAFVHGPLPGHINIHTSYYFPLLLNDQTTKVGAIKQRFTCHINGQACSPLSTQLKKGCSLLAVANEPTAAIELGLR